MLIDSALPARVQPMEPMVASTKRDSNSSQPSGLAVWALAQLVVLVACDGRDHMERMAAFNKRNRKWH